MVDEPQHQHESRRLVAVHRRGEQDLGLVLLFAGPVGDDQRPQSVRANQVGRWPEVHQPTERRVISRELVQQGLVLHVARVTVPGSVDIIHPSLAAHPGFHNEARRGHDLPVPSRLSQTLELPRCRRGPYIESADVVDADQAGQLFELRSIADLELNRDHRSRIPGIVFACGHNGDASQENSNNDQKSWQVRLEGHCSDFTLWRPRESSAPSFWQPEYRRCADGDGNAGAVVGNGRIDPEQGAAANVGEVEE